jgi:hypothetical protein
LRLPETIDRIFDQSDLYFKEGMMSIANVSFFPVTLSLPVVLTDFAMNNRSRQELVSAVFYPLSVYDDAASTALRVLRSRWLYEEIKAEGQICLLSVTRLIADSAFYPIRRFSAVQLVSDRMRQKMLRNDARLSQGQFLEGAGTVRMGVLLEQNQLTLLGSVVDTKKLLADRLNQLMAGEVKKIVDLVDKHGVLVSIGVTQLLNVLKTANQIFVDFGIPMMPVEDLWSNAMSTDTPNSLQSLLLVCVIDHLLSAVVADHYLLTYPLRLVPTIPRKIAYEGFFSGSLGIIMAGVLGPTSGFVSVENFRELFWKLDDGAITILHDKLLLLMPGLSEDFIRLYRAVSVRMARISNCSILSSCTQAFDRFEGAYRYFMTDGEILDLLRVMAQIGNILGVSEMMDDAFCLKLATAQQISTFFVGNDASKQSEVFALFDAPFRGAKNMISHMYSAPGDNQVTQLFLGRALEIFVRVVLESADMFAEKSRSLLDVATATGFAAKWSVIEFLLSLMESEKMANVQAEGDVAIGGIARFGEGVLICGGIVLALVKQRSLYRLFSIGDRISGHKLTDLTEVREVRVKRFLAANSFVSGSTACAMASYQALIDILLKKN